MNAIASVTATTASIANLLGAAVVTAIGRTSAAMAGAPVEECELFDSSCEELFAAVANRASAEEALRNMDRPAWGDRVSWMEEKEYYLSSIRTSERNAARCRSIMERMAKKYLG